MNRGIARRTVFESRRDVRYFLSCIARTVHSGQLEVHAFTVLSTHFHLLVRSRNGELSLAMERALNDYVRWFNRVRRRDGPLFRGRFFSRPVESFEYRRHLIAYIDDNPVAARVCAVPELYPHGSAWHYSRPRGPRWLERGWVEARVRASTGAIAYDPNAYRLAFGRQPSRALARIVERRLAMGSRERDPLDDLLGTAPQRVLEWMRWKAALADGMPLGSPVCDAVVAGAVIARARATRGDWRVRVSRNSACAWRLVHVALLRDLCGSSWVDVATRVGTDPQTAVLAYRRHALAIISSSEYAAEVDRLGTAALEQCFPSLGGDTERVETPHALHR